MPIEIDLGEAKDWLGITDDASDDRIELLIPRAGSFLEEYTGRYFGPEASRVVELDSFGTQVIWLDDAPSASPAPVVEEQTDFNVWEVVPATDYRIVGNELIHRHCWAWGRRRFRITSTFGYDQDATNPDNDFQLARQTVLGLVNHWLRNRTTDGFKSETIKGYSYTTDDDPSALTPEIEGNLTLLRWVRV